ncbi:anion permease [Clostridia bacterium OttesenSCG-928-O13]|nr:anion permease [Clostridia bacterium OttesenSCG-928-O13]
MEQKPFSLKRPIILCIALALLFLGRFLPPIPTLSADGMQVLCIFAGTLLLWLTLSIDWPSILCIGALALVPSLSMNGLLSASFGNSTFAFLLFTFLCTYALSQTPFIRRCAVGFVCSRPALRGPWAFCLLFFASVVLVGCFISPTVLFVVYLPIIEEIFAVLELKKGDKAANMLMIGLVVCCGVSSGMTPIAHVFPLMAMGFYTAATGAAISYTAYMAFAIPAGLLSLLGMMLVFRFVLRPGMAGLKSRDALKLKASVPPMDKREKTVLVVFGLVVLLWVLPGLLGGIAPGFSAAMDGLGTAFPPLLGVAALSILTHQGKPLLPFGQAMAKGVPWTALVMAAGTLALGSALSNADVGLTAALGNAIMPLAQGMAPLLMVALFALWATVQTNLSSNMVTVTVVTAIAIPVCLASGGVNTAAVCAIVGMLSSFAFAFPPAMPCVAIAGASGWTTAGDLAKYGSLIALVACAIAVLCGYPIAAALMPWN